MLDFSQDKLNDILNSALKSDVTFCFSCQMCGACCRKRQEPIVITGLDIFRIAKALNQKPLDVITKYTKGHMGSESNLPVIFLDERPDGSCKLLHKGKCTVQQDKPIVCALYPLGRFLKPGDTEFGYILSTSSCLGTRKSDKQWTLQQWLENFGIQKYNAESLAWNSLLLGIAKITANLRIEKIPIEIRIEIFNALYANYSIDADFIKQVEGNKQLINSIFKKKYNKTIN